MTVAVVVACAQPLLCEALAATLSSRAPFEVVASTTEESAAVEAAQRLGPAAVLASLELGGGSGLTLARKLLGVCPTLLLTRLHEGDILFDVVGAGAMGAVHHDSGLDELADLLGQVAAGRFALAPDRLGDVLRRAVARQTARADPAARVDVLTAREREVLTHLAQGLDNAVIARRLYLSSQTVRTHVGNILKKLDVHSRAQAARVALEAGIGRAGVDVLRLEGPELGRR